MSSYTYSTQQNKMQSQGSHFIIENANEIAGRNASIASGRTAGSSSMDPGYLNPLNIRTISQGVNIDTRFRQNYYTTASTNFVLELPEIQKRVVTLRIASIEIPTTHYAISHHQGNTTFLIQGATTHGTPQEVVSQDPRLSHLSESQRYITLDANGYSAWLVSIPDGNYELDWLSKNKASSIVTAINNAIAYAIPGYVAPDGRFGAWKSSDSKSTKHLNPSNDIAYNVDRVSGKSVFARPSTSTIPTDSANNLLGVGKVSIQFAVDIAGNLSLEENLQLRLGWMLGFRVGKYETYHSTQSTHGLSIISEGICLVSGPRYAYISINDGQKSSGSSFIASYANSSMDKNIMTRINMSRVADDVGIYKSASDVGLSTQLNRTREYFGPVDIRRLEIKVMDEYGRIIDLNHMDWSMTLVFEKLYS
jgi:hypothetical protein